MNFLACPVSSDARKGPGLYHRVFDRRFQELGVMTISFDEFPHHDGLPFVGAMWGLRRPLEYWTSLEGLDEPLVAIHLFGNRSVGVFDLDLVEGYSTTRVTRSTEDSISDSRWRIRRPVGSPGLARTGFGRIIRFNSNDCSLPGISRTGFPKSALQPSPFSLGTTTVGLSTSIQSQDNSRSTSRCTRSSAVRISPDCNRRSSRIRWTDSLLDGARQ